VKLIRSLFQISLHITNTRTGHPVNRFYGVPGGNIQIRCFFPSSGQWRIFCRENCKNENILIETNKISSQTGRYRIESDRNNQYFTVSISALTRSDSGWYRCGQRSSSSRYSYQDFDLVVAEALLDGNEVPDLHRDAGSSLTVACSFKRSGRKRQFCRGGCGKDEVLVQTDGVAAERGRYSIEYEGGVLYVSISALTRSDSGWYRCNLDLERWPDEYRDFYLTVTDGEFLSTVKPTTTSRKTATTRSFSSSASSFTASGSSAATD
uniref:Immunoglobulin domain-containing protein n=1 Tax=Poecilia formosa TaxID=48698 RepID=A0A096M6C2_POEFO